MSLPLQKSPATRIDKTVMMPIGEHKNDTEPHVLPRTGAPVSIDHRETSNKSEVDLPVAVNEHVSSDPPTVPSDRAVSFFSHDSTTTKTDPDVTVTESEDASGSGDQPMKELHRVSNSSIISTKEMKSPQWKQSTLPASPATSPPARSDGRVPCITFKPAPQEVALNHSLDLKTFGRECPVSSRMSSARCSQYVLFLCGAAVYASNPPLHPGRDEMPIEVMRKWSNREPGLTHSFFQSALHTYWMVCFPKWAHQYCPHKKHFCDNMLPHISAPIPCKPPAGASCECPFEIMPEMCKQLLTFSGIDADYGYRWFNSGHQACFIRFGGSCYSWPCARCKAFKEVHRIYIERRKAWNCTTVPPTPEEKRLCNLED